MQGHILATQQAHRFGRLLTAASAWRDGVNPKPFHRFVSRKICFNSYQRRRPSELLAELDLRSGFLQPCENDLEVSCGWGHTAGCVDGHDGGPFSLQRWWFHL